MFFFGDVLNIIFGFLVWIVHRSGFALGSNASLVKFRKIWRGREIWILALLTGLTDFLRDFPPQRTSRLFGDTVNHDCKDHKGLFWLMYEIVDLITGMHCTRWLYAIIYIHGTKKRMLARQSWGCSSLCFWTEVEVFLVRDVTIQNPDLTPLPKSQQL